MRDALRQLLRDTRSQKLRTFLTVCGIVWGTVSVSLLLAFGKGLKHQQIKRVRGLGDRIMIVWPGLTSIPFEGLGKDRKIHVAEEDVEAIRQQASTITQISSEYRQNMQVHYGAKTMSVHVNGVSPEFGDMRNLNPQPGGRFFDQTDLRDMRRVAFIGDNLAHDIFGDAPAIGKLLLVNGTPFLIVGVQQKKLQNSSYGGRDRDALFIPGTTFRVLTGQKYVNDFIYQPKPSLNSKTVIRDVRSVLARRLRFDPDDKEAMSVWDTTENFHFFDVFFLAFNLFLGIIGSLTLVVGGIGVSNIMNVVVEERTKEIGIKMALGAREGFILRQFLLETLLLTAAGGAIGLLLSIGICAAVPAQGLGETVGRPELSPALAGLTAGILGLIGFVAGYFPAREASRMDPVVAMKL